MTVKELTAKYCAELDVSPPQLFRKFNAGLGVWRHTRQLYYLWLSGKTIPGRKTLLYAQEVYSPASWQYRFATELYDLCHARSCAGQGVVEAANV